MKYGTEVIPVCDLCTNIELKGCEKCGIHYCKHFASPTDFRFCSNCMYDFKVVETIETKITEHLNDAGEVVSRKRQVCKNLRLQGTDWLFTAHKITTLTDEELIATIEYHREIASRMLQERETRRVEHYQKLKQVKLNFGARPEHNEDGTIKKPKAPKRERSSKAQPDANAIAAAFATLLGGKLSPDQITAALEALGKS
jgi:hypothetical protein